MVWSHHTQLVTIGNKWSRLATAGHDSYSSGCTDLHEGGRDAEECHGEAGQTQVRDEHVPGRAVLGPAWKEGSGSERLCSSWGLLLRPLYYYSDFHNVVFPDSSVVL